MATTINYAEKDIKEILPKTLVDLLLKASESSDERKAFSWLCDDNVTSLSLTYPFY